MFDEVVFHCPSCGAEIEAQSNGGECRLRRYGADAVPLDVASDVNHKPIWCNECGKQFKAIIAPAATVQIVLLAS
jgi:transcription elongation factor Elf1